MREKLLKWCIKKLTKKDDLYFLTEKEYKEMENILIMKNNQITNLQNRINQTETDKTIQYLKGVLK